MNTQKIHSIIQLMKNNEVIYTIDIEEIDNYEFYFDSKKLSTLSITVSQLKMKDLKVLFDKPYDHYVLIGTKTMGNQTSAIPAKVYNHATVLDNGQQIKLVFSEENENGK